MRQWLKFLARSAFALALVAACGAASAATAPRLAPLPPSRPSPQIVNQGPFFEGGAAWAATPEALGRLRLARVWADIRHLRRAGLRLRPAGQGSQSWRGWGEPTAAPAPASAPASVAIPGSASPSPGGRDAKPQLRDARIGQARRGIALGDGYGQGFRKGVEAMQSGRYAEAAAAFRALAERRPDLPRPRLQLARAAALDGDCGTAHAELAAVDASRVAAGSLASVRAVVSRRCAPSRKYHAAFGLDMGLPGEDQRPDWAVAGKTAAPLLDRSGQLLAARMTAAAAEDAWSAARLEVSETLHGGDIDRTRRASLQLLTSETADSHLIGGLATQRVTSFGSASGEFAADMGADFQALRTGLTGALKPSGADGASWELGLGAEARQTDAGARIGTAELRFAAETPLVALYRLRVEAANTLVRNETDGVADVSRAGRARLALLRPVTDVGAAAMAEFFAGAEASRDGAEGWAASVWRTGARLRGFGPGGGATAELALARKLDDEDTSIWLLLTRAF